MKPSAAWKELIQIAERQLDRSRVKTQQLEALLRDFRLQAARGEPCPTEVADGAVLATDKLPARMPDRFRT